MVITRRWLRHHRLQAARCTAQRNLVGLAVDMLDAVFQPQLVGVVVIPHAQVEDIRLVALVVATSFSTQLHVLSTLAMVLLPLLCGPFLVYLASGFPCDIGWLLLRYLLYCYLSPCGVVTCTLSGFCLSPLTIGMLTCYLLTC